MTKRTDDSAQLRQAMGGSAKTILLVAAGIAGVMLISRGFLAERPRCHGADDCLAATCVGGEHYCLRSSLVCVGDE